MRLHPACSGIVGPGVHVWERPESSGSARVPKRSSPLSPSGLHLSISPHLSLPLLLPHSFSQPPPKLSLSHSFPHLHTLKLLSPMSEPFSPCCQDNTAPPLIHVPCLWFFVLFLPVPVCPGHPCLLFTISHAPLHTPLRPVSA